MKITRPRNPVFALATISMLAGCAGSNMPAPSACSARTA